MSLREAKREVKKAKKFVKGLLTDPFLYGGFVLQAIPVTAQYYLDIEKEFLEPEFIISGVAALAIGNFMIIGSFYRNYLNARGHLPYDDIKDYVAAKFGKRNENKDWEYFKTKLDEMRAIYDTDNIEDLRHLIKRGERLLETRSKIKGAFRVLAESDRVYERHDKATKQKHTKRNSDGSGDSESNSNDPAPSRWYSTNQKNQNLRLQYFKEDTATMISEDQCNKLNRNIRRSKWYKLQLSDSQTYALFDDITMDVRKGLVPTTDKIQQYVDDVLKSVK